jgi:hypothetical protein
MDARRAFGARRSDDPLTPRTWGPELRLSISTATINGMEGGRKRPDPFLLTVVLVQNSSRQFTKFGASRLQVLYLPDSAKVAVFADGRGVNVASESITLGNLYPLRPRWGRDQYQPSYQDNSHSNPSFTASRASRPSDPPWYFSNDSRQRIRYGLGSPFPPLREPHRRTAALEGLRSYVVEGWRAPRPGAYRPAGPL